MHINIQGLYDKTLQLEIIVEQNNIDVLCITEHWMGANEIKNVVISGFQLVAHYARSQYNRGGVCIFAKDKLEIEKADEVNGIDKEFEIAIVKLKWYKRIIYINCIYRSPNSNLTLFDKLEFVLSNQIIEAGYEIIICGDLNIDLLKDGAAQRELVDNLIEYNLVNKISVPTRITSLTQSSIDVFFTNMTECQVEVIDNYLSDHTHQIAELTLMKKTDAQCIKHRCYSKYNMRKFHKLMESDLSEEEWDKETANVDTLYTMLERILIRNFYEAFPLVEKKANNGEQNKNKWITLQLRNMSKMLCEMAEINKRINSTLYNERYISLRKFYKKLVKNAKKSYNDERITQSTNISRTCWNIINEERNNHHPKEIKITKSNIAVPPEDVPDLLNRYFADIATDCPTPQSQKHQVSNAAPINSIYISRVTPMEVDRAIQKSCKKKSSGIDEISGKLLSSLKDIIIKPLCSIINKSFDTGIYPNKLKCSKTIPVLKNKNKPNDVSNFRPLSLQNQCSKIFECCFHSRLCSFLEKFQLLNPAQHGFRKSRSTATAIDQMIKNICEALENKDNIIGLFFDMSRAFDSVDHPLLLEKLYKKGIRGNALKWLRSYLTGRTQRVWVNNMLSDILEINRGVPQGSILGPLLFIIMIDDLLLICPDVAKLLYADDTSMSIVEGTTNNLIITAQNAIRELQIWCTNNGITLNVSKTQMLQFYSINHKIDRSTLIRANRKSITLSDTVKFLGLTFDNKLTWEQHLVTLTNKLSAVTFLIRKLRSTVSILVLKNIYFGLVQSHLAYGLIFWGSSRYVNSVFKVQKKILRIIEGVRPGSSCVELFKKYKIMTVYSLYMYKLVLYNFNKKVKKNKDYHEYGTRGGCLVRYDFRRLAVSHHSVDIMSAKCFNKLPLLIRNQNNQRSFKKLCSEFFTNNVFYTIEEYLS